MALGLFGLEHLAKDQGRPGTPLGIDGSTFGQNFPTEAEVDEAFEAALAAGASTLTAGEGVLGRIVRLLRRSWRACVGSGHKPFLAAE